MQLQWLDEEHLPEWDRFQMSCPRGHYAQLSTWLRSFKPFGAAARVLAARDETGRIIGGLGCVIWRRLGMELWVAPAGPVVETGDERHVRPILDQAAVTAERHGAMALIVQPLVGESAELEDLLLPPSSLPTEPPLCLRERLPGMAVSQLMWIDFHRGDQDAPWEEGLLSTFSQNTRRDIRAGLRSSLSCFEAQSPSELREVYGVIEANGRAQGYPTRTWQEYGDTLIDQVNQGQAILLGVRHQDELLGAHYGVMAGRRYSYLMGGTVRTVAGLRVGHYTHWMAITKARELGLLGYDFTSGGSTGVNRFKMGFRPEVVKLEAAREFVFRRPRYEIWTKAFPMVRRHGRGILDVAERLRQINHPASDEQQGRR